VWSLRIAQWTRASFVSVLCFVEGFLGCLGLCVLDQVVKGARWMPGHQEPMKDVGGRDSPRGAVNQAVIRGCPNGETRQPSWAVTLA
jgi:hypothetical protein